MTAFDLSAASQDSREVEAALHDPDVLSSYTQDHTSQRAHFHDTFQLHVFRLLYFYAAQCSLYLSTAHSRTLQTAHTTRIKGYRNRL